MKLTCLAILASITVCNLTVCGGNPVAPTGGQGDPEDETRDRSNPVAPTGGQGDPEDETGDSSKTIDDMLLQRAEGLLLRSILFTIENDDGSNEGISSQPQSVEKRQFPGGGTRYYSRDLKKRQLPERREEEDEEFQDVQKRQNPGPGKRQDENMDSLVELDKRQHPGKRVSALLDEVVSENPTVHLIGELSKRQYPSSDYEDETEGLESDHQEAMEKRQHPGGGTRYYSHDLEKRQFPGPEGISSQPERVEKRQFPGGGTRYYSRDLKKRQLPERREEEDEEEFQDVQKRQNPGPGKRQDEVVSENPTVHLIGELSKRQYPSSDYEDETEGLVSDHQEAMEKRQFPGGGTRYYSHDLKKRQVPERREEEDEDEFQDVSALLDKLVSENPTAHLIVMGELSKRQYPSKKRDYEDETEAWESEHQEALEKRHRPGKQVSDNTMMIPDDLGTDSPCNALDPVKCNQANLLLHLLQNFAMQGRAKEKRQFPGPGKRFAPEEDLVEPE